MFNDMSPMTANARAGHTSSFLGNESSMLVPASGAGETQPVPRDSRSPYHDAGIADSPCRVKPAFSPLLLVFARNRESEHISGTKLEMGTCPSVYNGRGVRPFTGRGICSSAPGEVVPHKSAEEGRMFSKVRRLFSSARREAELQAHLDELRTRIPGPRVLAVRQNAERQDDAHQVPDRGHRRRDRPGLPSLHALFARVRVPHARGSAADIPRHARPGRARLRRRRGHRPLSRSGSRRHRHGQGDGPRSGKRSRSPARPSAGTSRTGPSSWS